MPLVDSSTYGSTVSGDAKGVTMTNCKAGDLLVWEFPIPSHPMFSALDDLGIQWCKQRRVNL